MKNLKNLCFLLPLMLVACKEGGSFHESKTFVGGKVVDAKTLNLGYTTYQEYCVQCHGALGNGQGPASMGMFPPPRNFTLGLYKFGNVPAGDLPHDEDFYRIIRGGLNGTAMLKWDISDKRLDAVTQYIKTFAPAAWEDQTKTLGEAITLTPDPYAGNEAQAIADGKQVYHVAANCQSCHSGYATREEMKNWKADVDETTYQVKLQDSDHGYKAMPPDFTWHQIRTGATVENLYLRISAGIGGAAMPSWKGVLEDKQIWAVAHYVKHLSDMRNSPAREELFKTIK
jgi:mono/diheme cytochrome c family protein